LFVLREWDEERGGLEEERAFAENDEPRKKRKIRKWSRMRWGMEMWYKERRS
jgi:hypothetical protein